MATRLVEIVNTEWRKITTVGDNGTCWKKSDGGIFVCSTDQEGEATLPLSNTNVTLDRAKRVPLDEDSPEVLQLNSLSPDDAFYALSLKDSAQIVIDSLLGNFGPELVINGNFANWTLDDPDYWNVIEDGDASSDVTEHANGAQMIRNPDVCSMNQSVWRPGIEKMYKVVVIIDALSSSPNIVVIFGGKTSTTITVDGIYTFYITTTTTGAIQLYCYNPCDAIVNSISAQECL